VGLGLPLSRRLARLLGGELKSIPEQGRGRFVLELPIAEA
jgi:signal transduction histidine kinase